MHKCIDDQPICELPLRVNILTLAKWIQVHYNKLQTNSNKLSPAQIS